MLWSKEVFQIQITNVLQNNYFCFFCGVRVGKWFEEGKCVLRRCFWRAVTWNLTMSGSRAHLAACSHSLNLLLLPFHCSFWILCFFAFVELWNPSLSRTDCFKCKPCWWGGSVALACWHSRSCLCHRASMGQKCHRKCHNNFLRKDDLWSTFKGVSCGAHPAWTGRAQSGKVFPLRRARQSSNFVLINHKQWKNITTSCCVCKKAGKVSGEKKRKFMTSHRIPESFA